MQVRVLSSRTVGLPGYLAEPGEPDSRQLRYVVDRGRRDYNQCRPRGSLESAVSRSYGDLS